MLLRCALQQAATYNLIVLAITTTSILLFFLFYSILSVYLVGLMEQITKASFVFKDISNKMR